MKAPPRWKPGPLPACLQQLNPSSYIIAGCVIMYQYIMPRAKCDLRTLPDLLSPSVCFSLVSSPSSGWLKESVPRAKLELKAKGALWKMPRGTPRGTTIQMKADFPSEVAGFSNCSRKKMAVTNSKSRAGEDGSVGKAFAKQGWEPGIESLAPT